MRVLLVLATALFSGKGSFLRQAFGIFAVLCFLAVAFAFYAMIKGH
jgi:hypothetical protein